MKKHIVIFCLFLLVLFSLSNVFAANQPTPFIVGVSDDASQKESDIADDLAMDLAQLQGQNAYGHTVRFSEIAYNDIYDQVTILLYENEAIIVIGLDGSALDIIFGSNAAVLLTTEGVIVQTMLSNEVRSANYLELFGVEPIEEKSNCVDTDDGLNYYEVGKTYLAPNPETANDDTCLDNRLSEFYCNNAGGTSEEFYVCPNGCSEGRCLNEGEVVTIALSTLNDTAVENETLVDVQVNKSIQDNETTVNTVENRSDEPREKVEVQIAESKGFFAGIIKFFVSLF